MHFMIGDSLTDVSLQNLPSQMPAEIGDMPTLNAVFLNNNRRLLTVPHSFGEAMKRGVGVLLDIHTRVLEAAEAQIGNWSTPGPGGEDARALRTVRERWQCDDLRNRVWNDPVSDPLTWKGVGVCNGRVTLLSLTGEKLTGMVSCSLTHLLFPHFPVKQTFIPVTDRSHPFSLVPFRYPRRYPN